MNELKPCPFCGGKAIIKEVLCLPPNDWCLSETEIFASCEACGSSSGKKIKPTFKDVSLYTVIELRSDPSLRVKVNLILAREVESTISAIINDWNARTQQIKWISINVDPKLHQRVITLTKDHDLDPVVGMAIYNGPKVGYLVNGGNRDKGVTHWMPEPPLTVGPTPPRKKDSK